MRFTSCLRIWSFGDEGVLRASAGTIRDTLPHTSTGTLMLAWASQKSFRSKDGSGDGTELPRAETLDDTDFSNSDPEAKQYRKSYGGKSKLAYLVYALVENRNGPGPTGVPSVTSPY